MRPRLRLSRVATTLAAVVAVCSAPPAVAQSSDASVKELVEIVNATRRYVSDYEEKLTLIVADENYVQRELNPGESSPRFPSRLMKSEMFFAFTPSTNEWLAVRNVKSVDGKAVSAGPDVNKLLSTMPAKQAATIVKAFNSRYNLGRIVRNYNEPTLSLLLFDVNWREDLEFQLKRVDEDKGIRLATIAFRERAEPTLIVDLDQHPVRSSGEVTVEVATGRVRKILLQSPIDNVISALETTYGYDKKLDTWVPMDFAERYVANGDEEVVCRATYSNFRRFEVHGGIK